MISSINKVPIHFIVVSRIRKIIKVVDQEALKKTEELLQTYRYNWGREADLSCIPSIMSQEQLVVVLERIVETGESILVGWNKCF